MTQSREERSGELKSAPQPTSLVARMDSKTLMAIFFFITAGLVATGYVYVQNQVTHAQSKASERLAAIADLKLHQICNWREERLSDARFFSHAPFVAADVQRLLDNPASESSRQTILRWLKLLKGEDRYVEVAIYDTQLNPLVALPSNVGAAASERSLKAQVLQSKQPAISDLHQDTNFDMIHIETLFPIFRDPERREGLLGFGFLKMDARQFLFPLIKSWPTASRTAETLLIRRENNDVLYLNDLRHRHGMAMNLRIPITNSQLPAARALLGETNSMEGIDYSGEPVVAVCRKVPGTTWAIVAKEDCKELYAPLRRESLAACLVIASLLLAGALFMALLWRQRGHEFLRRELATERKSLAERKAHEKELERMNRLYAALSQVNQTIVRIQTRDELFKEICRVIVQFGDFRMAWLGWLDSKTFRVLPVAQFGDHSGYLQQILVYADDRPEGHSPAGTAIRESSPCILNNCMQSAEMPPWRETMVRSGWRSIAAFPVFEEGRICASLAVYSEVPDHFGPKETALLAEAASDISFALDSLLNTDRRQQAEEELRRLNAELEKRINQRTSALENKNRELESFAYSVSHDLKTPLRSIAGYSHALQEEYANKLDASGQNYIQRIVNSTEHMNQLIEDLLSYSRLEIQEAKRAMVDVSEVVQRIVQDHSAQMALAKTQVKVDIQAFPLNTDPQGLEQALRNLIGNAIKFSSKTPRPCVEIIGRDKNDMFILMVRDNGIGFDMQNKEKIFQIFQRAHSANDYPGTGIGLAIVRKAVERAGGNIKAESEPGKGASFTLEIPRQQT